MIEKSLCLINRAAVLGREVEVLFIILLRLTCKVDTPMAPLLSRRGPTSTLLSAEAVQQAAPHREAVADQQFKSAVQRFSLRAAAAVLVKLAVVIFL